MRHILLFFFAFLLLCQCKKDPQKLLVRYHNTTKASLWDVKAIMSRADTVSLGWIKGESKSDYVELDSLVLSDGTPNHYLKGSIAASSFIAMRQSQSFCGMGIVREVLRSGTYTITISAGETPISPGSKTIRLELDLK